MRHLKTTALAAGLLALSAGQAMAQVAVFTNDTRVPIQMEFGGGAYTVGAGDTLEVKIPVNAKQLTATPAGQSSYSEKLDFPSTAPAIDPYDNAAVWCVTLSYKTAWVSTYNVCNSWVNDAY